MSSLPEQDVKMWEQKMHSVLIPGWLRGCSVSTKLHLNKLSTLYCHIRVHRSTEVPVACVENRHAGHHNRTVKALPFSYVFISWAELQLHIRGHYLACFHPILCTSQDEGWALTTRSRNYSMLTWTSSGLFFKFSPREIRLGWPYYSYISR